MSYRKVVWILAVAETLHNLEEFIWLPGWSRTSDPWRYPVGAFEFRFAVVIVTLLFYAIIYDFSAHGTKRSRYLVGGLLVLILFNVLVPHLLATIVMTRLAPGVVTAILVNVPVTVYLLRRGLREGVFSFRDLAIGTAVVAAMTLPLLPIGFAVGRVVQRMM